MPGNRSPLADNAMRGILAGIALDPTTRDLALRYLATCEAIALQTRQILDSMNDRGHEIKYIFMSGK
jgi:ribulose kinase